MLSRLMLASCKVLTRTLISVCAACLVKDLLVAALLTGGLALAAFYLELGLECKPHPQDWALTSPPPAPLAPRARVAG